MSNLRKQLREKVKRADNLLSTVKGYLEEVGSSYSERVPSLADRFALLTGALDKIKEGLAKLYEEM